MSSATPQPSPRFWEEKTLAEMSQDEWEQLCDGCGKCCLHKLIDDETDELYFTDLACQLLDLETCQCSDYSNRIEKVAECQTFSAETVKDMYWLPTSCAYRTLAEGRKLEKWHHLISGNKNSVHRFKRSVKGKCVSENDVAFDDWQTRVVKWV
ncbi:YcgN family cysteine cluster protein [Sessilibacter corallicola]|uniref:YcgN family cysteine cluster protein n=1 Tax=Sessilibacter corallicola TaxID=2904075 RepID=UPI001E4CAEDB|nr:YcgN family cysteine cluster protein [Sessilibacter corallicola]